MMKMIGFEFYKPCRFARDYTHILIDLYKQQQIQVIAKTCIINQHIEKGCTNDRYTIFFS